MVGSGQGTEQRRRRRRRRKVKVLNDLTENVRRTEQEEEVKGIR